MKRFICLNHREIPFSSTRRWLRAACTGLNLEDSIDKSEAVLALKRLFPGAASAKAIEKTLETRGSIVDELFGGRVSFQVCLSEGSLGR